MFTIDPALVEARNGLNRAAMAAETELLEILVPYIGRKVRKTSGYGGWVAKLEPEIKAFIDRQVAECIRQAWISCQASWIDLECKTIIQLPERSGCTYLKAQLSIGKVDESGVLLELFQPTTLRTDYTVSEIEFARARAYELESQARDLRHQVREFDKAF